MEVRHHKAASGLPGQRDSTPPRLCRSPGGGHQDSTSHRFRKPAPTPLLCTTTGISQPREVSPSWQVALCTGSPLSPSQLPAQRSGPWKEGRRCGYTTSPSHCRSPGGCGGRELYLIWADVSHWSGLLITKRDEKSVRLAQIP